MSLCLFCLVLGLNPLLQDPVYVDTQKGVYHVKGCAELITVSKMKPAEAKKRYKPCTCAVQVSGHFIGKPEEKAAPKKQKQHAAGLVRCAATTNDGTRCQRTFETGSYCWQHEKSIQNDGQCTAVTNDGTRCLRKVKKGEVCWQHKTK